MKKVGSSHYSLIRVPDTVCASCIVPRAVPVVEAMTALVLADFLLLSRCARV